MHLVGDQQAVRALGQEVVGRGGRERDEHVAVVERVQ